MNPPAAPRLLFVTYGGGHVRMVIPVLRALAARGQRAEVLALTTARESLRAAGFDSFGFQDLVGPDDGQALAWGRELAAGTVHPAVDPRESEAYLGLSFAELVGLHGLDAARAEYARLGRAAFLPVETLKRAIRRVRPQLVVTTSSPRAETAAVLGARELGVPALCLVDLFANEEIRYIGRAGYADRVCVLDDNVRARFLAAGRRPEEVVATGNAAFDTLASPALAGQAAQWLAGQPWRDKRKILWLSQPEPARHRITGEPGDPSLPAKVLAALQAAASRHPDWHLIVRPHPSEDASGIREGAQLTLSTQAQSLHMLLHAVDAAVVMTSTAGYEAALVGKPLVHLPLSIYRDEADYSAMGLALRAPGLEQLELALKSVVSGRWAPTLRLPAPGGAAGRVVQVLDSLLPPL